MSSPGVCQWGLIQGVEAIDADITDGAHPPLGQVLKRGTLGDAVGRVPLLGIVNVPTVGANVFHSPESVRHLFGKEKYKPRLIEYLRLYSQGPLCSQLHTRGAPASRLPPFLHSAPPPRNISAIVGTGDVVTTHPWRGFAIMKTILSRSVSIVVLWGMCLSGGPGWAENQDDAAIDDYNFAAWLYNEGKYGLAVDSYGAFLDGYADHAKAADARFGLAQSLFHLEKFTEAVGEYETLRSDHKAFAQRAEVLFQLAQSYVTLEQHDTAAGIFADLADEYPEHYLVDWAAARQAACLIALEKYTDAERLLAPFLETYAPDGKAPAKVSATRDMLKRLDKAGIDADAAFLDLVARSAFHLAVAQFNQDQFGPAADTFASFRSAYPKHVLQEEATFRQAQALYRAEKFSDAADAYSLVAGGTGDYAATAGFERGLSLYKARKLKEAADAFAAVAERFPEGEQVAKARLYAGTFLFEAGDYARAAERLRPIAEAAGPDAPEAAYWLGMSLLKSGKRTEAGTVFDGALKQYPKSSRKGDMQLGLADARLAEDKFADAAAAFRDYAEQHSDDAQAPRALYSACVALHRESQYGESDALCGKFLKMFAEDPLVPDVLFLSAENRFLEGKYKESARRYAEVLKQEELADDRRSRVHFRLAWVERYEGRHEKALVNLAEIGKGADAGVSVEAEYLRGASLFDQDDHEPAIAPLERYLKAPDHARYGDDALLKLAVSLSRLDRKTDAVKVFERLLKDYPKSDLVAQGHYQLAEVLYDLKRYDAAAGQYRAVSAQEDDPDLIPYGLFGTAQCLYDMKQWQEAATAFADVVEQAPKSDLVPQALFRQGRSLMKRQDWDAAVTPLQQLLADHDGHELERNARIAVGTCLQEQGKWDSAAAAFKDVSTTGDGNADQARILYELAWSRREAGQDAAALEVFRDLVAKHPDHSLSADAYFYLGEDRYAEKGPDETEAADARVARLTVACDLYAKVLAVAQDQRLTDKVHYRLGWCRWLMEQYPESAAAFDALIESCPKSSLLADALFQSGQAHARAGKTEQATERYSTLIRDRAFKNFGYLPEAQLALGELKLLDGDAGAAAKTLEALLARDEVPDTTATRAHFLLGRAHYEQRDYEPAMEQFKTVARRTKSETGARAQFFAGQVYQVQDDYKRAIVAYLRVIALFGHYDHWVAAAKFESGKCHEALGHAGEAKALYEDVVKNHKKTEWAAGAKERLAGM